MIRTRIEALALVNWRGIFYQRYDIDRHVTAFEGNNGAGKTTMMIAAYIVLLPDMSRLRFTNVGETGATGGDKGIWGRLGEIGRPSYSVIDFTLASDRRLIAGVHLERKGEPSLEIKPFIITDLDTDTRLQDVLLLLQGDDEVVPELDELRENTARRGGRMHLFGSVRDYFAALFEHGVMPLRLGSKEERNKFNEMLRTSMMGGISRVLTSELRSFLLKEESGLADTLQRMKANLDACRRTRTEVQESQRLQQEIGEVFEAGQAMFAAVFFATRERADKLARRVAEAKEAQRKAQERLADAEARFTRICEELGEKETRQEALTSDLDTAKDRLSRLRQALAAAEEVSRRREELSSAEEDTQAAANERTAKEKTKTQSREVLRRRQDDYKSAAAGLADFQQGYNEIHRRAGAYRQALRRKQKAERLLEIDELALESIAERLDEIKAWLDRVDRSRREAKQRLADADDHRREYATALEALERMADAPIEPDAVHETALHRLRRFRKQQMLAERLGEIAADLEQTRNLAERQSKAKEQADKLSLALTGQRPARIEITEHLERAEQERESLLERAREAEAGAGDCQRTLDADRARQKELGEREAIWRELAAHAEYLAGVLECTLASLPEIKAARATVAQRLEQARANESELVKKQESLRLEARDLLAAGGPFDPDLLRLKDALGAELLAGVFEEVSVKDAALLEARLGPLVQALVVEDPAAAADRIHDRPESLGDVWLVGRNEDAARLGTDVTVADPAGANRASAKTNDVVVSEQCATRVTRIPDRPRLGRKAREKRAEELRVEADESDARLDDLRTERRRLERLAAAGEALLEKHVVWLDGDPTPMLAALLRRISRVEKQQENHRAAVARYREDARRIEPRIEALRALLGVAAFLDPPDHVQRRDSLEREYEAAQAAQAEIQRCGEAVRVVEDRIDLLRRAPLSQAQASKLESDLRHLSDERDRLDAAIEAMEFVADNADALGWDDAPALLDEKRSLAPALEEQLQRAQKAQSEAEAASKAADDAFDRAKTRWQDADGRRRAALEQFRVAQQRFTETGIEDPTPAAVDAALERERRLQEEAKSVAAELDALKIAKGSSDTQRAQAARDCDEAKEKLDAEQRESVPAIERWERLQAAVAEKNLHTGAISSAGDTDAVRTHGSFIQEAYRQKGILVERLRAARGAKDLLAKVDEYAADNDAGRFADSSLELWLAVRDWFRGRLPAQVAEVDEPREALQRLRDRLTDLEDRLARQEGDLRGASGDIARGIEVQIRKARGQVNRLNQSIKGAGFGSIENIRVKTLQVERMEQVLRALREGGAVQELLFQDNLPVEEALEEIFARTGGGRTGGQRLLDYREYLQLQVEVRRVAGADWEIANPTRLSTGEAIGVGAALMMVVLTEWERDANLLRPKKTHGSLRLLFLDEANRLSEENLEVLFELCRTLELQLLIAAPEVAKAGGNTTYRLARTLDPEGREKVIVSGRRARSDAARSGA